VLLSNAADVYQHIRIGERMLEFSSAALCIAMHR